MHSAIKQRVKDVLLYYSKTVNSISKEIGIPQNTLTRQIHGGTSISTDTILSIIGLFPDISIEWLLTGKGNMLKQTYGVQEDKSLILKEPLQPFGRKDELNEIKDKYINILEENRELRIENEKLKNVK